MAPAAAVLAVFCVTLFVKYNAGVRHVMVVFPLLAVVAGYACSFLWQSPRRWHPWGRSALLVLLLWQCISSLNAHPDYIAYFNELAGPDPSRVLVTGCDLDCGQDLFRLSRALHERNTSQLRSLRMGDVLHTTYPPGAFAWLDGRKPVEQIGKTIHLYYLPPNALTGTEKAGLDSGQPR